jgi:hypothetical protein
MRLHLIDDPDAMPAERDLSVWRVVRVFGLCALALLALILALPVFAQEAAPVAADFDPMTLVAALVHAIQAGQWPVAVVLCFVAVIAALKRFGAKWIPWLATSEGGTVLALLTTAASILGAAAIVGTPITWALVGQAAAAGFATIGGYVGVRRLLRALVPLVARIPRIGPLLARALSWVSGADVKAEVAKKADAAYQPLAPAPTAAQAEDALFPKPPVP